MKSERRHELQTNSLAATLTNAPELLRAHGSKILLVVIVILLGAILWAQRVRQNRQQEIQGASSIATARTAIQRLANTSATEQPAEQTKYRKQYIADATAALNEVSAGGNREMMAEAYLLRGDLNWTLANLPENPAAATQPSLKLEGSPSEYLTKAEEDYNKLIKNYPNAGMAVTSAKFGLAAVAENRRDFATAGRIYEQIKDDTSVIKSYRTLADMRLKILDTIKTPVYLAPASQPTTKP